jgi:hypothetical protein
MPTTTPRTAFLIAAPLVFAALLMLHPIGGDDFATLVSENLTPWLAVHYGAAVLFPLMGYVIWLLIRDLPGRAATVARIAIPVYAIFYGVYEAMMGLATGIVTQHGNGMTGAERDGVAEAVNAIASHAIVGEGGLVSSIGSLAWIVAITGAILALRAAGVRRSALVLLGIGTFMAMHIPPIGPVALVCLSGAALLIERHREAPAHAGVLALQGGARDAGWTA